MSEGISPIHEAETSRLSQNRNPVFIFIEMSLLRRWEPKWVVGEWDDRFLPDQSLPQTFSHLSPRYSSVRARLGQSF